MGRQRNMSQVKEENKAPEKELNKIEKNNPLDVEFKILVIRVLHELKGRVDELSEKSNQEIENMKIEVENIKKNQPEMKTTITEIKNTLEGINSRLDEAEN